MAKNTLINDLRKTYVDKFQETITDMGEDALLVGPNIIAFPVTDAEGNEHFIKVTISIPTGSRDGDEYDGYSEADGYATKLALQAEKQAAKDAKLKEKLAKQNKEEA